MDAQITVESPTSQLELLESPPSTNQTLGHRPNAEKTQLIDRFFDLKAQVDSDEENFDSDDDEDEEGKDGFIDDQESDTSSSFPSDINQLNSSPATGFLDRLEHRYTHREAANSLRAPTNFLPSCTTGLSKIDKIRLNNTGDWITEKLH
ncbi:hypothetical protein F5878DRAFT_648211 [Lentinula raphanica]|uniref:Uncharacterized protein n=1 Tax=Lentinula raphanica TaxID=153919 RepID=A0AA38NUH6_9AGAR|nr:hypothetical protein F5878DRAFT_648211 [Lentinula raphanica]